MRNHAEIDPPRYGNRRLLLRRRRPWSTAWRRAVPILPRAVPYYGVQVPVEMVPAIKAPLLLQYAETDENINKGIAAYEAALKANNKKYHAARLSRHAACLQQRQPAPPATNKAAADLAWSRTLAFLCGESRRAAEGCLTVPVGPTAQRPSRTKFAARSAAAARRGRSPPISCTPIGRPTEVREQRQVEKPAKPVSVHRRAEHRVAGRVEPLRRDARGAAESARMASAILLEDVRHVLGVAPRVAPRRQVLHRRDPSRPWGDQIAQVAGLISLPSSA